MKQLLLLFISMSVALFATVTDPTAKPPIKKITDNSCIDCHKGIEPIRDHQSKMMKAIFKKADKAGAKGNDCIVCHGGSPTESEKEKAHSGTLAYFEDHKGPKAF